MMNIEEIISHFEDLSTILEKETLSLENMELDVLKALYPKKLAKIEIIENITKMISNSNEKFNINYLEAFNLEKARDYFSLKLKENAEALERAILVNRKICEIIEQEVENYYQNYNQTGQLNDNSSENIFTKIYSMTDEEC